MTFLRYPHLEKYGKEETQDIDFGVCHIFPKLDGTNASVWYNKDFYTKLGPPLSTGSRNRELSFDKDNAGFHDYISNTWFTTGIKFFEAFPDYILYGEWLVPHSIKDYRDDAWKQFYVFDVWDNASQRMLSYDEYKPLLDEYNITYIPCVKVIKNPSYENLMHEARNSFFLMKEGKVGEGIVIKNYDWKNKYGHQPWAKIINQEFKEAQVVTFGPNTLENVTQAEKIADKACTSALIDKEYAKIVSENNGWHSKFIPRLLHTVFYCVVTEELWDCLKMVGRGSVNFQELQAHCIRKVKAYKPDLF